MIKNTSAILSLLLVIFALTEGKADGGVHVHVVQTVARKRTLQLDSSSRHDNMNNDQQQGGSSYNNADDGNMNGGVQYSTNNPLLNEGYYYDGAGANGTTAISFDSYIVTTVNPGNQLLLLTLGICLCCFIIGYLALPGKCMNRLFYQRFKRTKGKVEEHGDDSVELKEPPLCKDGASRENEDSSYYDQEMGANEYITDLAEEKANRLHVPSRGDDDNFEDNPKVTDEGNDMNKRVWKETRKIIGLGTPWMIQSIIADGSSIVTVMIISHYMGLRELICYSNVWFVINTVYLINDPWYDTVYKHVNVSAASGTEEGYRSGGLYLKIGVIGNFILALPLSIVSVVYMPTILRWIGYDESIVEISQSYALVAAVNNFLDSTTGLIDCVLDIEGHAKFTAVYEFWESIICTFVDILFVRIYQPTLWELGLFHLAADVVSTTIYFIITGYYKRWFECYREGLRVPVSSAKSALIKKLVTMTVPLIMESFMGNVEYTVLTIFAAYQGTAEAASWVLLSYVWSVVGIAPDSFGAASSCHVAKLLGQEDGELAKQVSWQSMRIGTLISLFFASLLLIFRKQFVWCFSVDATIEQMLYELIPYIAICQPFFTVCWTAMELDDALHLFKKAMVSNAIATSLIIIPLGYIMTYTLHFNLEGIVSAQCIGYTVGGVANIIFFAGADWDKAVRKAQDISNVAKKNVELLIEPSGYYDDDYNWDDMPIEVRAAAIALGYNQYNWDNDLTPSNMDYDNFTKAQLDASKIMGYTKEMYNTIGETIDTTCTDGSFDTSSSSADG